MNAAIYARVSTDAQAEYGYSLGAQIADCTSKAKEMGATFIKEFIDDGYSGAYLERPALESLRASLRAGMFSLVVVYDIDRLSRNLSHQLLITDDIESAGATLAFCKANYEASPEGRLFYAIRGAFAGYEREKIRERSMRGRLAMLRQGKVIEDSHVYGYDYDKSTHSYVVNETEASVIREIFKMYLDGYGGMLAIARHLNANLPKYPPPSRKKWVVSTIRDILRRDMYTGNFFAHKIYHFKTGLTSEKKVIRPPEEWIPMTCPAIISEDEHQRALAMMDRNRTFDYRPKHIPHLFQGLLRCARCGRTLSVKHGSKRIKYYMCLTNHADGHMSTCGARSLRCDPVDDALWALITDICKSEESIRQYISSMEAAAPTTSPQADISEQLERIKAERKNILSWVANQLVSFDEAETRLKALRDEESRLVINNTCDDAKARSEDVRGIYEAIRDCPPTAEAKRQLVRQIIDHVDILRTDDSRGAKNYQLTAKIYFA